MILLDIYKIKIYNGVFDNQDNIVNEIYGYLKELEAA
jgi:hypothetical protein